MLHQIWFKPKVTGYGATPSSWEGWAVTGAYGALIAIAALVLLSSGSEARHFTAWVVFAVFVLCLTAIFVLFCKAKTEGDWHWRNKREQN